MYIDISVFSGRKPLVIDWYEKNGKDVNRTVSMMSGVTSVPCIAIAYWLGEHTNWDPLTIAAVKRLTEFYKYTEIDGKPEGSPL
jgi:hypothetical protein